jgi:hypothetical protein
MMGAALGYFIGPIMWRVKTATVASDGYEGEQYNQITRVFSATAARLELERHEASDGEEKRDGDIRS